MVDGRFPRTRATWNLLYESAQAWIDGRALRLGAGVAYYALFALVPVLFLSVSIATLFLGQVVSEEVESFLVEFLGDQLGVALAELINQVDIGGSGPLVSLVGVGALLFTSSLLFVAWKELVDLWWGLPRERGVRATLSRRLFGVTAVIGSGLLLTINLAVGTALGAVDRFVDNQLVDFLLALTSSAVVVGLGALFLGILFKFTPDSDVSFRFVWFAALVTMAMLVLGAWAYGVYLEKFALSSAAGVAGAVFLGLVLIYYVTAIALFGIEIVRRASESDGYVPLSFRFNPRSESASQVDSSDT